MYSIKTKSVGIKLDAGKTYYIKVRAFYFSKGSDLEFLSRYSKEIKITTKKKD